MSENPTKSKEREIATIGVAKNKEKNTSWKTVKRKKKPRIPAKTDVMIISSKGETTYAGIHLKKGQTQQYRY